MDKEKIKSYFLKLKPLTPPQRFKFLQQELEAKNLTSEEYQTLVFLWVLDNKDAFAPEPLPPKPQVVAEYEEKKANTKFQYEEELLKDFYDRHPQIKDYYDNCRIMNYVNKVNEKVLKEAENYQDLYNEIMKGGENG